MDPVTLIVAALAAGASAGAGDTVTQAIKDAYAGLKELVKKKFAGTPKAQAALDDHAADPDTYDKVLAKQVRETGADRDDEIIAAATELLRQAQAAGIGSKYTVTVTGGTVGIIGDGGHIGSMT